MRFGVVTKNSSDFIKIIKNPELSSSSMAFFFLGILIGKKSRWRGKSFNASYLFAN